jgi:hypothetical protein
LDDEGSDSELASSLEGPVEDGGLAFEGGGVGALDAESGARIVAGYREVAARVAEAASVPMATVETEHFLIFTDFAKGAHGRLGALLEGMYGSVAEMFGVGDGTAVFAGKVPVFCLRTRRAFERVAWVLDDYSAGGALGYTSMDGNGHVHVVMYRQGGSAASRDSFASTLVHEGTHAFLHRYKSVRHVPNWLNEGLADFVAERVLGESCAYGETADATALAVVGGGYSLEGFFSDVGTLDPRYYPVAHSMVRFLVYRDGGAVVKLVDSIKSGVAVESALEAHFGLDFDGLEEAWRASAVVMRVGGSDWISEEGGAGR